MSKNDDRNQKAEARLTEFKEDFAGVWDRLREKIRPLGTDGLLRLLACCRVVMGEGNVETPSTYYVVALVVHRVATGELEARIDKERRSLTKGIE